MLPTSINADVYEGWKRKFTQQSKQISTYYIEYDSDGYLVNGIYMQPNLAISSEKTADDNCKYPLIVFNRGGRAQYGMLNILTINSLLTPLVQKGYIILASNYRGSNGGEGEDEFGGAEVADINNLIDCGKTLSCWDQRNIYMFGWSRGGMMTLLAIKHGAKVNAVALGAPLIDLTLSAYEGQKDEAWLQRVLPDYKTQGYHALERRSAPYWLDKLVDTPILLLHGDADKDVSITHSRRFASLLASRGSEYKLVEFTGGNHYLNRQRDEVMREVDNWFRKFRK